MSNNLYQHFHQGTVLETINAMPGAIAWVNLDNSFFAVNQTCLDRSGFIKQDNAEGKSYADMPCRIATCHQEFIAENDKAKTSAEDPEFLGLHCYHNDEWKVTYGVKKLIRNSEGQPIGICENFMELKNAHIANFLSQLAKLESHFQAPKKQICYQLTNSISPNKFSLTERQSECLFYLLRGFNVPMIAERLDVSKRTVESHIENIKLKIGCFAKVELIEKALSEGWTGNLPRNILAKESKNF